jgi:hypothetical protein
LISEKAGQLMTGLFFYSVAGCTLRANKNVLGMEEKKIAGRRSGLLNEIISYVILLFWPVTGSDHIKNATADPIRRLIQ